MRAQHKAALSWYVQYVREGGTGSAARYLFADTHRHIGKSRPFMVPRFDFSQLDYRGLIETYDALFGRDRVHLFAYEMLARDRKATLARLCADLDLALADQPLDTRRVNDSYRRALLPLARFANLFTYRSVSDKRTLVHLPYWYTVRKALLISAEPPAARPAPTCGALFLAADARLDRSALLGKQHLAGQAHERRSRRARLSDRSASRRSADAGATGVAAMDAAIRRSTSRGGNPPRLAGKGH